MKKMISLFLVAIASIALNVNATSDIVCPAEDPLFPVLLPDPDDCRWYYECSNGRAYHTPCAPDEHFDRLRKVCDWPSGSGCFN